ncbi:MAG: response regulator [Gemmatimonadaceae bacterium]|nr:response regulator [Gemmatimonadaceae bacterium]
MASPRRSVLWVDDEAELLESHRLFLRDNGYDVLAATNADDAMAMLARHPVDVVLLDEQMPGKRGLEAYRDLREIQPGLAVIMVTKSEDPATLREALGADIKDYLVKPLNPRQVLAALTRLLDGAKIRSQQVAQRFVDRFRTIELAGHRDLDWRGWMERSAEVARWDVELAQAGEYGLLESLAGSCRRCSATSPSTSASSIRAGSPTSTATGRRSRWMSCPSSCCRSSTGTRRRCWSSSTACASTSGSPSRAW